MVMILDVYGVRDFELFGCCLGWKSDLSLSLRGRVHVGRVCLALSGVAAEWGEGVNCLRVAEELGGIDICIWLEVVLLQVWARE